MCSLPLRLIVALVLVLPCTAQSPVGQTVDFHVGVILDMNSPVGRIGSKYLWMAHSDFYSVHGDYKTRLILHPADSNGSLVDAAAAAFHLLRDVKVDAIIGPQESTQVDFVMDLGDRAHVPIISFSATRPSLRHHTPYFIQTAQSDANQVQAIASIIEKFQWKQVVMIYEDTKFGNGIIPYLSNALQDVKAQVSYKSVLPLLASDEFISKELYQMMAMETRVFVVHTSQSLGSKLLLKARELGMLSEGYTWIVTCGLIDSDAVGAMQGVLGVRPLIPKSRLHSFAATHDIKPTETSIVGLWVYDTLWALAKAAEEVGNYGSEVSQKEANVDLTKPHILRVSETGPNLCRAMSETRFTGLAGEFSLVNGQLEQTAYEIVNVVESIKRPVGTWIKTGGISGKQNLKFPISNSAMENFVSIIWPGNSTVPPRGWEVKRLKIAVPSKPGFNEFMQHHKDVFNAVMAELPHIPYRYVSYPMFNDDGSRAGSYDDLVYQVSLRKDYDGALGDITITANRSNYVDFTMPYADGGVACIVPIKYENVNAVSTFIEPLTNELWITTALFYIVTSVILWILSKRILHRYGDFPGQHAAMIGYIPFFPGEGIEANLVCLILVTWTLVAGLLNSTYTASLSSRLTVAKLHPSVTDVTQLIKDGKLVGCQEGSFLVNYLKKKGFIESKIKTFKSADDIHVALSLGNQSSISAYCDVMPHIRSILSLSCDKYKIISPIYRTDGFALAFPKGFPAISAISEAILQLTEDGIIEDLGSSTVECPAPGSTRVDLRSFVILFAFTGFVTVTCFVSSLIIRLHNQRSLLVRASHFIGFCRVKVAALWKFLKRNDPPCLPKTSNSTRDEIMQLEMRAST